MIFEGSRYEHADVERTVGPDGVVRVAVLPVDRVSDTHFTYSHYTVIEGDRIDVLAHRFLGDAELWWVLADHNPEWQWYEYIPPGVVLRIPAVGAAT